MRNRDPKQYHVLTVQEAEELQFTPMQWRWLRSLGFIPPIAGAESQGEGAGGEGTSGEGEGAGTTGSGGEAEGEGSGGSDESEGEGEEGGSEGDGEGHPNDRLEVTRSDYERLRRIAREHDQAQKKSQREEQRRKEQQRKEQGQYEELLKEKDDRIVEIEQERDEARYQLDAFKRRIRVQGVASRLGYKDADDAHRFLSDEDTEDDASTERALKSLAKKKPYLVQERKSTGAPVTGDGVTLTKADIDRMSPEEINANWDAVQKAMASGIS